MEAQTCVETPSMDVETPSWDVETRHDRIQPPTRRSRTHLRNKRRRRSKRNRQSESAECERSLEDLPTEIVGYLLLAFFPDGQRLNLRLVCRAWSRMVPPDAFDCRVGFASSGHLGLIHWAHNLRGGSVGTRLRTACTEAAARSGLDGCLAFLHTVGLYAWDVSAACSAAAGGHLAALRYLVANRVGALRILEDQRICAAAAGADRRHILVWFETQIAANVRTSADIVRSAALGRHRRMVKWLRLRGYPWDHSVSKAVAEIGAVEILDWLHSHACPCTGSNIFLAASIGGHLPVLEWAHSRSLRCDDGDRQRCVEAAARSGHLPVLEWLYARGWPFGPSVCEEAASGGHVGILAWLNERGIAWNEYACRAAAKNGDGDLVRWLHQQGCPWNAKTCEAAVMRGDFDMLRWCVERGCPTGDKICRLAAKGGSLEMLQWLRQRGCPWDVRTCRSAAKNGHLEVLRWAKGEGCPCDETVSWGGRLHPPILRFLLAENCPWQAARWISDWERINKRRTLGNASSANVEPIHRLALWAIVNGFDFST